MQIGVSADFLLTSKTWSFDRPNAASCSLVRAAFRQAASDRVIRQLRSVLTTGAETTP